MKCECGKMKRTQLTIHTRASRLKFTNARQQSSQRRKSAIWARASRMLSRVIMFGVRVWVHWSYWLTNVSA
eukprot:2733306-Amphidinium_carterae.1